MEEAVEGHLRLIPYVIRSVVAQAPLRGPYRIRDGHCECPQCTRESGLQPSRLCGLEEGYGVEERLVGVILQQGP